MPFLQKMTAGGVVITCSKCRRVLDSGCTERAAACRAGLYMAHECKPGILARLLGKIRRPGQTAL